MIFLTVGTQFPFDRLVDAVDRAIANNLISKEIFGQIGESSCKPRNFKTVPFLVKDMFDQNLKRASAIIGHAGMGIISLASDHNKPLLVMPRRKLYGEAVNDHQVAIAKRLGGLGHFLVAYEVEELPRKLKQMETFIPCKRDVQPQVIVKRIAKFLAEISSDS